MKPPAAKRTTKSIDWTALAREHRSLATVPEQLRLAARMRPFASGETLFRQGDRPAAMMFVLRGEIRLLRRGRRGGEIVLQRARGGFFAEASVDAKGYHCDAVAAEAGELVGFPIRAFRESLRDEAAFREAWITQLAREVRKLRSQCERLGLNSAAERIVHYLESEGSGGEIVLAQSKKAFAAELGLTHEAFYRTLARLQGLGVIAVEGNRISLLAG